MELFAVFVSFCNVEFPVSVNSSLNKEGSGSLNKKRVESRIGIVQIRYAACHP